MDTDTGKDGFDKLLTRGDVEALLKVHSSNKLNLSERNLRGVNLSELDLSQANFNGADLSQARLNGADLSQPI